MYYILYSITPVKSELPISIELEKLHIGDEVN